MNNLPVEIINKEIGSYLDIPSMISMSFVCKDFQDIYQPQFQKIVNEMDPYITNGTIHDFLNITKVGTLENIVYKIWRIIFQTIIRELECIYPYLTRKFIISSFHKIIPIDAVDEIKSHIKKFLLESKIFIIYKNVLYRNPLYSAFVELSETFETDINDMIDSLLHDLSASDRPLERDNSIESITDDSNEEIIEYFPYENITDAIESWIKYL